MNPRVPTIALVALLAAQSTFSADGAVTGLFSTFGLSGKPGDISGAEIHIVPNPKGYSAIVQASEGAPGFPEVVDVVAKRATLVFAIPQKFCFWIFSWDLQRNGNKGGADAPWPKRHVRQLLHASKAQLLAMIQR